MRFLCAIFFGCSININRMQILSGSVEISCSITNKHISFNPWTLVFLFLQIWNDFVNCSEDDQNAILQKAHSHHHKMCGSSIMTDHDDATLDDTWEEIPDKRAGTWPSRPGCDALWEQDVHLVALLCSLFYTNYASKRCLYALFGLYLLMHVLDVNIDLPNNNSFYHCQWKLITKILTF